METRMRTRSSVTTHLAINEPDFVESLVLGDPNTFAQLVRLYQDRVFNLCFRLLGSEEEARDVSQEVFLTIFRKVEGFNGASQLSTWIYRVATNHALNRIKAMKRRRFNQTVSLSKETVERRATISRFPRPDQMLDAKELERYLQAELDALDDDQRTVVVLRDLEGLSYQEIEDITGLNPGTVKSRLHRGRTRLKEALERWLDDRVPKEVPSRQAAAK